MDELRELVASYRPNREVLEKIKEIQLLATVAPSASGKTTVMEELVKMAPDMHLILADISRPPRRNERSGVDYIFRSQEEILKDLKEGQLVQVAIGPNNDLYGTRLGGYPREGTGVMALVPSSVKRFRSLPIKSMKTAFIVPASYELWQQWLSQQATDSNWTLQQKHSRLEEAKTSYEFALNDTEIQFVLNDIPSEAAKRLLQVARGKPLIDEDKARKIALDNYQKLKTTLSANTVN